MRIEDAFTLVGYCHCSECQKFSGSGFSVWAQIQREKVLIEDKQKRLTHYDKNADGRVGFCGRCGSSLYNDHPTDAFLNIRFGILDDAPTARPTFHVYCASRAPWDEIDDALPQFDTIPGPA